MVIFGVSQPSSSIVIASHRLFSLWVFPVRALHVFGMDDPTDLFCPHAGPCASLPTPLPVSSKNSVSRSKTAPRNRHYGCPLTAIVPLLEDTTPGSSCALGSAIGACASILDGFRTPLLAPRHLRPCMRLPVSQSIGRSGAPPTPASSQAPQTVRGAPVRPPSPLQLRL